MRNVTLILDDGSRFHGKSFGYEKPVAGEVVFNTATVYLLSLSRKTDFLILWKAKKFMPKRLS